MSNEKFRSSLNEECGVVAIHNHKHAAELTYFALHSLQHRGQEAAGIATYDVNDEDCHLHSNLGLVTEVFNTPESMTKLTGDYALGHVRYATDGNNILRNVQPFVFRFHDQKISFAHNGQIVNAKSLRNQLEDQGAVFNSTSDTELLIHLIRRSPQPTFMEQLKDALRQLEGGFTFVLMVGNHIYGAVDPYSFRPLVVGQFPDGGYMLASETCALDVCGAEFVREVKAGEIIHFHEEEYDLISYTENTTTAIEAMEYVYFARPDSNIAGINVHTARKNSGKHLAEEASAPEADIVIGVPNSSLSAASGYAEASGLPYEMGLVKNQYVGRSFIQPTQALRDKAVRMKLSAVRGVVQGKSVVMVDDSIVRGTTCKRIVRLLKNAGAKEVHVRIASPLFMFPSFYGIDVSTSSELIAAHKTEDEIREYIGADSLSYLSVDGLVDAIGIDYDAPYNGLCMESFTGYYPAPIADFKERYLEQLTPLQEAFLDKGKQVNHAK